MKWIVNGVHSSHWHSCNKLGMLKNDILNYSAYLFGGGGGGSILPKTLFSASYFDIEKIWIILWKKYDYSKMHLSYNQGVGERTWKKIWWIQQLKYVSEYPHISWILKTIYKLNWLILYLWFLIVTVLDWSRSSFLCK